MIKINHNHNMNKKRGWETILLTIALAVVLILPTPSFATSNETTAPEENLTKSQIEYCKSLLGWILCPILEVTSEAADTVYGLLERFLKLNPEILTSGANASNEASQAQKIWQVFRDVANVLLVIAFLIVIMSYVTGYGLSTYNIKKMLPKLIVAAVLINLSFLLVQITIDISNIIGSSIKTTIDSVIGNIAGGGIGDGANAGDLGAVAAATAIVATGFHFITPLMAFVFPIIISIILTCLLILLLLVIRQAVAILVAVFAPIAFASMVLPNTEKLFSIWKSALTSVIITYPLIAMLFSASKLVGSIIAIGGSGDRTLMIIGAAVQAIPMVVAPSLIQSTMASVPLVGKMATSFLNKQRDRGVQAARNADWLKSSRNRWQKKYDNRATNMPTFTKYGKEKRQRLIDQQAQDIAVMSRAMTDQDAEAFAQFNRTGDKKALMRNLSQTARVAYIQSGKNTTLGRLAAAEKMSLNGDADTEEVSRLMAAAADNGAPTEQLRKLEEKIFVNSTASGNLDLAARMDHTLRQGGSYTPIYQNGTDHTTDRINRERINQINTSFLAGKSAAEIGRATPASINRMSASIEELYSTSVASANVIDQAINSATTSTSPGSASALHNIVRRVNRAR